MIFLAAFALVLLEKHALSISSSLLMDTLDYLACFISFLFLLLQSVLGGLFLTITNDDIRSMHGGAQHGLRISAFWLLASGSCSRSASFLFA